MIVQLKIVGTFFPPVLIPPVYLPAAAPCSRFPLDDVSKPALVLGDLCIRIKQLLGEHGIYIRGDLMKDFSDHCPEVTVSWPILLFFHLKVWPGGRMTHI